MNRPMKWLTLLIIAVLTFGFWFAVVRLLLNIFDPVPTTP